jgi:putative acetyltransferase
MSQSWHYCSVAQPTDLIIVDALQSGTSARLECTSATYHARMDIEVRAEVPADSAEVRDVIAAALYDETVAVLWEDLAVRPQTASFVAGNDHVIVGHVGLSLGWVDSRERLVEVGVLSPLSVQPEYQRRGVGRALVATAIEATDGLGWPVLFLEGDPGYYLRSGFEPAANHGFTPPSPRVPPPGFQCVLLSTYHPSLTGRVVYPDTFWVHDRVGVRGELLERFGL